jgi:sucrose phosphorylase
MNKRIIQSLISLYGEHNAVAVGNRLSDLMVSQTPRDASSGTFSLSQHDALLITYADQLSEPGVAPLQTLADFCHQQLRDLVSGVHLLPFYPWSSDDGFSVKDFFAIEPTYGNWADVARFRPGFDLMFDAVFNHMSAQGDWFQKFLADDPTFRDFFVTVEGNPDLRSCAPGFAAIDGISNQQPA